MRFQSHHDGPAGAVARLAERGEAAAQGRADAGEAVVDGLRSILAGIGAATHGRTVPHIHVQHGEVRGATLASGQVLPPGGIAVGTEDLALTGADYVALGHIHKGQQLNPAEEYGRIVYSGSAYPVDWGERDEKLLRVVTIGENRIPDAEHVPYGHPARIKLELEDRRRMAQGLASVHGRRRRMVRGQRAGGLQRARCDRAARARRAGSCGLRQQRAGDDRASAAGACAGA